MKLLVLLLCCISSALCDSQAEASEPSSSSANKLTSSKSSLNSIPSAPAQKTTLIQQTHSLQQQPQQQYVPQYLVQKQVGAPQHQQPAAMFIIAQPGPQSGPQNPLFQQAVQQLLSYYSNNPQAKYQLLQQQGGLPQGQALYQPHMPTGALHVIPSPQLDQQQSVQQLSAAPSGVMHQQLTQPQQFVHQAQQPQQSQQSQQPQATYIIPAQSQQILSGIAPGLLAQLTGQAPQPQHIPVPVQFAPQPQQYVAQPYPAQLSSGNFLPQQIPQFSQNFPAGHYTLASQFGGGLPGNIQLGGTGPQLQFGAKQPAQNTNEYSAQTEKSHQVTSSSGYNPVYRTAYVKG